MMMTVMMMMLGTSHRTEKNNDQLFNQQYGELYEIAALLWKRGF